MQLENSDGYRSERSQFYLAFDTFISTNQAEDDNYFIAIVGGSFYKTSAPYLSQAIAPDSELMQYWQEIAVEKEGEVKIDDSKIGSILYKAEPIKTTEEVIGVFVVAYLTAGERQEVLSSFNTVVQILLLMILLALVVAWMAAGRILTSSRTSLIPSIRFQNPTSASAFRFEEVRESWHSWDVLLERTFNAIMERIEDSFATQRSFINDAGHELRTPITIIRGHLELMDVDTTEQRETVDLTIDELARMNRLVEDLVLLAKAERPDTSRSQVEFGMRSQIIESISQ